MRRYLRKPLKWLAGGLAVLVLLLVGALVFLLTSETAVRWAWAAGQDFLPEGVAIESIEGRLISDLDVRGIAVDTETMQLRLAHARLRWRAGDLFNRLVHIELLALTDLEYTALPGPDEPPEPEPDEPFELPEAIDLPVAVALDAFTLDNAVIRTAPDAEPIIIEQARLVAALDDESWRIEEISGQGPLFAVDGGAQLTPRARYSNQVKLDWRFNAPDLAPITGKTRVAGDLDALQLDQSVAAPYNVTAKATVRDPLEQLAVDAELRLDKTSLAKIKKDLPPVTLSTQAAVEGTLADLGFRVDATAAEPEQGTAKLDLAGRYTGEAVMIEGLSLTSPDTPGKLKAHGRVALAEGNAMDLELAWQRLQWPLAGAPEYASPEGKFSITGKVEDYRVDGGLRWRLAGQDQEGRLKLAGQGTLESFALETLALSGAPGELNGSADIAWAPALKVSAKIDGQNLNPGALAPDWPGDFELHVAADVQQKDDGLYAQVARLSADGSLREQPLNLDLAADYSPAGALIERLTLVAGETRLSASGQVTEPMAVEFALDSSDLGTTLPGANGEIHAQGQAKGAYLKPQVVAQIDANGLAYGENSLQRLALDADVDWTAGTDSDLSLTAAQGSFGAVELRELTLRGDGRPRDHSLALAVDSSEGQAEFGMDGDFNQDAGIWKFLLTQGRLAYKALAPWRLAAPAAGQVSASAQSLEDACWNSGDARLCLAGSNDAEGSRARFSLDDFSFDYIASFIPENLNLTGGISGKGSAALPAGGNPEADINLRTAAGRLAVLNADEEAVEVLRFEPGEIAARLGADGSLEARADLPLANGGVKLDAQVPGGDADLMTRPLTGNLDLQLESLAFVPQLAPEVTELDGSVDGSMVLSGTLAVPRTDGRLELKAPLLALDTPGLRIVDLSLAVVGSGREIDIEARANSGGGALAADGNVALTDAGPTVDMTIRGEEFQVLDNALARVLISPDMTIGVTAERIDIDGELTIPQAAITPRNIPAGGGVSASGDQVIVSGDEDDDEAAQESASEVAGRDLYARIRINIGDPKLEMTDFAKRGQNYNDIVRRLPGEKVKVDAFGMEAVLAGSLVVVQEPEQPPTGSGELRIVVGQYKAYGQDLSIEDGRVLFSGGPVSEPALDVRAVRRPKEDILVGVRVRGPVAEPELTVFSEPSMTQSEQLSWLVLGRPLSGASSSETSLVTKAALAIGLKGGDTVTENLRGTLGVDQLGIESSDAGGTEQAALVVGKYLTPKLYVSYGLGLFDPVSTVRLRYTLSPLWRLETQSSGTATGGDLIYEIEVGQ